MSSTNKNKDEHERTSLLASSSAPPEHSRPRPTLNPYNPSNKQEEQQPQLIAMSSRQTLSKSTLEEMERGAARLADDNIDSDSVNALLAGMEETDDEASLFGDKVGDDEDAPVTMNDLEFLASSSFNGEKEYGERKKRVVHNEEIHKQSERVHESTRALRSSFRRVPSSGGGLGIQTPKQTTRLPSEHAEIEPGEEAEKGPPALTVQVISMVALTLFVMLLLAAALLLGTLAVGPPRQPVGEYKIVEAQVGEDFWKYYDFYAGKDSAGSNGYITYVSRGVAEEDGIIEVVTEEVPDERMIEIYEDGDPRAVEDWLAEDMLFLDQLKRQKEEEENAENEQDGGGDGDGSDSSSNSTSSEKETKKVTTKQKTRANKKETESRNRQLHSTTHGPTKLEPFNPDTKDSATNQTETFVVISSSPTPEGPRNSIRLEGRQKFNRGLFIIDLRHMPAGCGTWPAFWLTDEANWPVNGEIDIVEGVNYQNTAKTALHSTKECQMDNVPEGSKTGSWDTSVGIPNGKTGIPDMTFRWAQNCFVYDPHQWINQGCVATDLKLEGRSLGMPLNQNGGGVYALEWDPVNTHIRTWVFSPHGRVPSNLRDAMRTATEEDVEMRIAPDTNQWGLPYGHFPIGEGTNCPAGHFRNMRLVINLAFCGSVAGNRYFMDCPKCFKKFKTCNEWVASEPDELKEAYWKIRGVYVYQRAWERQWA